MSATLVRDEERIDNILARYLGYPMGDFQCYIHTHHSPFTRIRTISLVSACFTEGGKLTIALYSISAQQGNRGKETKEQQMLLFPFFLPP